MCIRDRAYAVGGCVRDSVLGRIPQDWDITTSAMPQETKTLFDKTFDTGIEHGTITVLLDHEGYEVTTYRIDGKYEDNRHPKEVTFTRSLKEDLLRRDFTINAMAYNLSLIHIQMCIRDRYYNEDILNALGEKAPETWDDFARICQEATKDTDGDGKVDQYGFACGMNTSDIGAMQILNAYYYSACLLYTSRCV